MIEERAVFDRALPEVIWGDERVLATVRAMMLPCDTVLTMNLDLCYQLAIVVVWEVSFCGHPFKAVLAHKPLAFEVTLVNSSILLT